MGPDRRIYIQIGEDIDRQTIIIWMIHGETDTLNLDVKRNLDFNYIDETFKLLLCLL